MSFTEFFAFIVSLLLLSYLWTKQKVEARKRMNHVEEEDEFEQEPVPPPLPPSYKKEANVPRKPQRLISDDYSIHPKIERLKPRYKVEDEEIISPIDHDYEGAYKSVVSKDMEIDPSINPYEIKPFKPKHSKAKNLINELHDRKNMIILKEIIGLPKAYDSDKR